MVTIPSGLQNEKRGRLLSELEDSTCALFTGTIKISTLGSFGDFYVSIEYPVCGEEAVLTSRPAPERGQRGLRARARLLPPRGRGPPHLPASVRRGGGRGSGGGHRGHAGGRSLGQELLASLRVPALLTNRTL